MIRGFTFTVGMLLTIVFAMHTMAPTYDVSDSGDAIETINYANGIDGMTTNKIFVHYDAAEWDITGGYLIDERTGEIVQTVDQPYDDGRVTFDKPTNTRHYRVEIYDFDEEKVGEQELPMSSHGTDLSHFTEDHE